MVSIPMRFIFDLDGTITSEETLPVIAKHYNLESEINQLTRETITGNVPFVESFIKRVEILKKINVHEISEILSKVKLHEVLLNFINENETDCLVATGNFSGWIEGLQRRILCPVISSEGVVEESTVRLTKILKKEELVRSLKSTGEFVVYIGDGNNDAEAMRLADVSIACGLVHEPSASVIAASSFIVYDEHALVRLLKQMKNEDEGRTLVLSCAGVGSRLGLGLTKALIDLDGSTLVAHHLRQFSNISDLRIVVGYQYRTVISAALAERRDIIFVLNHDYFNTKTGASVFLGSRFSRGLVLAWDGDFIAHPDDLELIVNSKTEFLGVTRPTSSDAVYAKRDLLGNVIGFTRDPNELEWSGPAQISRKRVSATTGHLYEMLTPSLPLPYLLIRGIDIDTEEDYIKAKSVFQEWYGK